jgi:quinol monooxygenase YgiN
MLRVIATITLHPGRREDFLRIFRELVPKVLAEQGCRDYMPMLDMETNIGPQIALRPDVVTVVEAWEDLESLENHLIAPHMRDYRKAVKDLVASVSLQILQPA